MAEANLLHDDAHSSITPATYVKIWLGLLVLLVLTSGAARVNMGSMNIVVAMTIAIIKAVLIFIYFMHLKISSTLVRLFAIVAFIWLIFLFGLTYMDYFSRPWMDSTSMYMR